MKKGESTKRLFFAEEVVAPWPEKLPHGRILTDKERHMTLAFLGDIKYAPLLDILPSFPKPPFKVGPVGYFKNGRLLPSKKPRVFAWEISWIIENGTLENYALKIDGWLRKNNFAPFRLHKPFLPHVTMVRKPFEIKKWKDSFRRLPLFLKNIHLYESVGNLRYRPIWSYPITAPFEEIEHAADLAFEIRGENICQIYLNAATALFFRDSGLIPYFNKEVFPNNLDDVIIGLNEMICRCDQMEGSPFKAVSFHGKINENRGILSWEMIVDV